MIMSAISTFLLFMVVVLVSSFILSIIERMDDGD